MDATSPPLSSKAQQETYTYADYAELPEGAPYELIDGNLVMSPSPSTAHQRVARHLFRRLDDATHGQDDGEAFFAPIDVILSQTTTLQPNLVFVAVDHASRIGDQGIEGPPDLVIEILSPSTAYQDLSTKKRLYEDHGVAEYWAVDPGEHVIEVYQNTDSGFVQHARIVEEGAATSAILDGFQVDLGSLFDAQSS